jgi:SAM-dependent methyltransferase
VAHRGARKPSERRLVPLTEDTSRWRSLCRLAVQFALHPRSNLRKWDAWRTHEAKISRLLEDQGKSDAASKFEADFSAFQALSRQEGDRLPVRRDDLYPCLDDCSANTSFDAHYIYHPAWAARILARTRPARHVDISSIVSFCAVVSAFVPVEFYDFRPAPIKLDNLQSGAADICRLQFPDASIPSLSCMHVIEHIGLGRYGDPLDASGDLKAVRELVRVLAPGGNLLVAVPVGKPRVQFNAHRVYDFTAFRGYFAALELVEFALISDDARAGLIVSPSDDLVNAQSYGCGCFWFRKTKVD